LRLFSFDGYGLALAALALVLFGAYYDSYPPFSFCRKELSSGYPELQLLIGNVTAGSTAKE